VVVVNWQLHHVTETGSTNADVAAAAREGGAEGTVLVAEYQTAGRGRLGRSWQAPPGTGLAVSMLLRPSVPANRWPWLPLLAGVAVVEALHAHPGTETVLKWPNDVLLGSKKLAGVLVERVDGPAGAAAVVGVGLNLTAAPAGAVSLLAAGFADVPRDDVLAVLLDVFGARYETWHGEHGDPQPWLAPLYHRLCDTLGREVRATLPDRAPVVGRAIDVDLDGRLIVRTDAGDVAISAGDVEHLRTER
jgi:BirA family biotin operon repressor/biotin-[acetyl-CoA-carboxylase] ligase